MGIRRVDTPKDDESRNRKLQEWDDKINETHINPYLVYFLVGSTTFLASLWIFLKYLAQYF